MISIVEAVFETTVATVFNSGGKVGTGLIVEDVGGGAVKKF